ncbi:hypothetical protein SAMN05421740_11524 [Parapedobacter koreensis]|uniref:PepSY-associated TM region n=1 Tax=Parapedobacter koreensis TaxID=332977 RepID=A0A1H7UFA5_9SPHI|nr:hypothetical protein SAMN05421740_11524 [Parapedobacter koreensis]
MEYSKKRRILAFIMALPISGLFLWYVLTTPNLFNMLPFAIHESINPGGTSENTFIAIFDTIIAGILLWVIYKMLCVLLIKHK